MYTRIIVDMLLYYLLTVRTGGMYWAKRDESSGSSKWEKVNCESNLIKDYGCVILMIVKGIVGKWCIVLLLNMCEHTLNYRIDQLSAYSCSQVDHRKLCYLEYSVYLHADRSCLPKAVAVRSSTMSSPMWYQLCHAALSLTTPHPLRPLWSSRLSQVPQWQPISEPPVRRWQSIPRDRYTWPVTETEVSSRSCRWDFHNFAQFPTTSYQELEADPKDGRSLLVDWERKTMAETLCLAVKMGTGSGTSGRLRLDSDRHCRV